MSTTAEPAPGDIPGPPGSLRDRLAGSVRARLAPGTRKRAVALAARDSGRTLAGAAADLRGAWTAPGVLDVPAPPYPLWLRRHRPGAKELDRQRRRAEAERLAEALVVILPGSGAAAATVASLRAQSAPRWGAFALGGETGDGAEARVTAVPDDENGRAALDSWLSAGGDSPVVLLRAGDVLAADCLFQIGVALRRNPGLQLVTWDDDILAGGRHRSPRFRPSWSPETLLGEDYPGRAFALRADRLIQAGGIPDPVDPAAHWDLLLRADVAVEDAARVPRVLSSVPSREAVPPERAAEVVQAHLTRKGVAARAAATVDAGVRLDWQPARWPRVTVVIPTRHNREVVGPCLRSLATTDYPDLEIVVVDNGQRVADNERWYADLGLGEGLRVLWWEAPFNYSAVNNAGAAHGSGQVLVFLNDDTEVLAPSWLKDMVGWALQPDIGVVGARLTGPGGEIQHEGVVVGMSGFADHPFQGMPPHSRSMFGPTGRLRNTLAVTGACCALRREVFDDLGGFDERFRLTGSDVALGLSAVLSGRRNVCTPHAAIRHLESATRGTAVPMEDYFASYWRYNPWLFGGDPYWHPALSLRSRRPRLRGPHEPTPAQLVGPILGRDLTAYRQRNDDAESRRLAEICSLRPADVAEIRRVHAENAEPFRIRTLNWFIPDIDSPFYGGINTALRIADLLARRHGVENRFVVWGSPPDHFVRSALAAAFPSLGDAPIAFYDESMDVRGVPPADAGIATLWTTAYALAHTRGIRRKFYLVQDFEPMFYPAGTQYALAEETYRMGFYGICNTDNLRRIYQEDYGGRAMSFVPAVDGSVFHANGRRPWTPEDPVTVFVYARPGHWRNCWELASAALTELKRRLGDRVHIVTAGARATATGDDDVMEHRGLLDYRATGDLYRRSDVGLALTVSKHPSYLPLELMACGVPVVAFDNPWGHWLLQDGQNSLLSRRTVASLADRLEELCTDAALRKGLAEAGLSDIAQKYGDWERALSGIFDWMCDPESRGA